jgi:hypothetical protein
MLEYLFFATYIEKESNRDKEMQKWVKQIHSEKEEQEKRQREREK